MKTLRQRASELRAKGIHVPRSPALGFISDSDIDAHNSAVTTLTAEVNAVADKPREERPPGVASFRLTRWTPYVMKWNAWVADHTGTLSRFADDEFAALRVEYGQLRQEWLTELQQKTTTPEASPGSSTETPEEGKGTRVTPGLLDTIFGGKLPELPAYAGPAAGAAGLLALLLLLRSLK
jgi:hypothetical protein